LAYLGLQARLPHPRTNLFGPILVHRHQVHAPTLRRKQGRDGGKKPIQDLPPVLPSRPAGLDAPRADFGGGGGDVGGVEEEDVDGVEEAGEEGKEEVDLEGFEVGDLREGGGRKGRLSSEWLSGKGGQVWSKMNERREEGEERRRRKYIVNLKRT